MGSNIFLKLFIRKYNIIATIATLSTCYVPGSVLSACNELTDIIFLETLR